MKLGYVLQVGDCCLPCHVFLVFNATFSNISSISWGTVLVMEESGVSGENH